MYRGLLVHCRAPEKIEFLKDHLIGFSEGVGGEVREGRVEGEMPRIGESSLVPRPFYKTNPRGRVWANDLPFGVAEHCIPL